MKIIKELTELTGNMYRLGWHERNAGNISVLLDPAEVGVDKPITNIPLGYHMPDLAGKVFVVTATGAYFKNIAGEPAKNLGIVRISKDGTAAEVLWGYEGGGKPTSEFAAHLMCHAARLKDNPNHRVIMHCHTTNLVAMNYIHSIAEKDFSRTLWQNCIEAILVFPEGVGVLPWRLCGTNEIGEETAAKMREYRLVMWAMHGIFGAGNSLDEAFGLIETAEKAAEIYLKTLAAPRLATLADAQIIALAKFWKVKYRADWLKE